jgi:cell division septation protein DedD
VEFPAQPAGSSSGNSSQGSSEFSFYKNLEAPEEHVKLLNDPNTLLTAEPDIKVDESIVDSPEVSPKKEAISRSEKLMTNRSGVRSHAGSRERKNFPGRQTDAKRYTVQVGAFSQPQVARGWASRWKRKGYKVMLKPVARPSTGVIYRLYLGDFKSEKEADKLVKRLRINEGITAFRLVLK